MLHADSCVLPPLIVVYNIHVCSDSDDNDSHVYCSSGILIVTVNSKNDNEEVI